MKKKGNISNTFDACTSRLKQGVCACQVALSLTEHTYKGIKRKENHTRKTVIAAFSAVLSAQHDQVPRRSPQEFQLDQH